MRLVSHLPHRGFIFTHSLMKLVFATNNAHKLKEVRAVLDPRIELLSLQDIGCLEDIPETAETLEGNALLKSTYVHERYRLDCFSDDTGLEVEALGGAPGVYSARYAGGVGHNSSANMKRLLHELEGKTHRHARFRTVISLLINGTEHRFEGIVEGRIATEPKGERGFGYDPVFIPDGYEQSFAELGEEVKNSISHRARAVAKLVEFLDSMTARNE